MPQVLNITNAHKRFGQTHALAGANLALNRGEWLALLGPNGAGKTTLVRAIAGRVILDQGQIELLGEKLDGKGGHGVSDSRSHETRGQSASHATPIAPGSAQGPALRKLGLVPQEIALYPLLSAVENLEVFGSFHGLTGPVLCDRVKWALDWTGLADRGRDLVKTFSGGMKRRLNIAAGVLHRPEVILLDEPTVGVDPQSRERIWEMCGVLKKDGASLLLTTHQLDEAQKICERIVIIDHGRAIAAGTFAELVAQTVGPARRITVLVDRLLEPGFAIPSNASSGAPAANGRIEIDGNKLHSRVTDVARELPQLLTTVGKAGYRVEDIQIDAPSLQAVFLHLTGRELRE